MMAPKIKEVSGVDHPAHLAEGWLVQKGLNIDPDMAQILHQAECIAKGIDPAATFDLSKGSHTMPISDEARAALPADVQEYLKSVEATAAEATAEVIKSAAQSAEDVDAAEFEKSLAGLPEPVRKSIIEQQRKTAEALGFAKAVHDEREDAKFEAMAKSLDCLPGVGEGYGATLRKAAESNPTAFDDMFKSMTAANAAIRESGLFKSIGTGATGTPDAAGSLEAMAKAAVAADTSGELTYAAAVAQVAQDNPELYAAHRKEN